MGIYTRGLFGTRLSDEEDEITPPDLPAEAIADCRHIAVIASQAFQNSRMQLRNSLYNVLRIHHRFHGLVCIRIYGDIIK